MPYHIDAYVQEAIDALRARTDKLVTGMTSLAYLRDHVLPAEDWTTAARGLTDKASCMRATWRHGSLAVSAGDLSYELTETESAHTVDVLRRTYAGDHTLVLAGPMPGVGMVACVMAYRAYADGSAIVAFCDPKRNIMGTLAVGDLDVLNPEGTVRTAVIRAYHQGGGYWPVVGSVGDVGDVARSLRQQLHVMGYEQHSQGRPCPEQPNMREGWLESQADAGQHGTYNGVEDTDQQHA